MYLLENLEMWQLNITKMKSFWPASTVKRKCTDCQKHNLVDKKFFAALVAFPEECTAPQTQQIN